MALRGDFTDPNSGNRAKTTTGNGKPYGPPNQPATSVKSIGLSGGSAVKDDPPVYMGEDHELRTQTHSRTTPQSQAYQQVFQWWGTPQYAKLVDHLMSLGLLGASDRDNIQVVAGIWKDAVDVSAALGPSKKVSPWAATSLMVTRETDGSGGGKGGGKGGGGSQGGTYTSRSVNLTDPKTARAMVNNVLSQALGRNATDEEAQSFLSTLNAAERNNPSISTTTVDASGTNQSVTSSGGLDQDGKKELLRQQATKLPEYGAYTAGTYYMSALHSLLGG